MTTLDAVRGALEAFAERNPHRERIAVEVLGRVLEELSVAAKANVGCGPRR